MIFRDFVRFFLALFLFECLDFVAAVTGWHTIDDSGLKNLLLSLGFVIVAAIRENRK